MAVQTLVDDRPSQGSQTGYPNGRRKKALAPENNPLHGTTIELFEEDFSPEPPASAPAPGSSAKHLVTGALGILVGGLTCLGLWAVGLEPPASWRMAGPEQNIPPQVCALLAAPESGIKNTVLPADDGGDIKLTAGPADAVLQTEAESEYVEELSAQLDSAQADARQARQTASEVVARNTALARELQNSYRELTLLEGKLQEATARANRPAPPPPPALRVETLPAPAPAPREPDEAFRRYAKGLQLYQAHRYADAEDEFQAAIASDDQDARYHYYLGLCRLELGKRGPALEGIQRGAQLEQENKPSRVFVILALEAAPKEKQEFLRPYRN